MFPCLNCKKVYQHRQSLHRHTIRSHHNWTMSLSNTCESYLEIIASSTVSSSIPVTLNSTWSYANPVCSISSHGLGSVHSLGTMHRPISPEPVCKIPKMSTDSCMSCDHSEQFAELERRIERNHRTLISEILNLNLKLGTLYLENTDAQMKMLSTILGELKKMRPKLGNPPHQIPREFLTDLEHFNKRASEILQNQLV